MVASDTVVGLVGAGILLVALVGVFVIESRDTSTDQTLKAAVFSVEAAAESQIHAVSATGVRNPVTNECTTAPLPGLPAVSCSVAFTKLVLKLNGLPAVGGGATYWAFLTNSTSPTSRLAFGALQGAGGAYSIEKNESSGPARDTCGGYDTLVVTLESVANASEPRGPNVLTKKYGPPSSCATAPPVGLGGTYQFQPTGGSCGASFNEVGGSLQVEVKVEGVTNHTGFHYAAWLWKNATGGASYEFLGNLTGTGATFNATTTGGVAGAQSEDFDAILVTLEPDGAATTGAGVQPSGPVAFRQILGETTGQGAGAR